MDEFQVDGRKDGLTSGRQANNGRHGDGDPLRSVELTRRKTLLLPSRSPPSSDLTWNSTSRRRGQTVAGIQPHPLLVRPLRRLTDPYGEGRIWPIRQKRISAQSLVRLAGERWTPMSASEQAALFTWSRDKICKRDQEAVRKVRGTYGCTVKEWRAMWAPRVLMQSMPSQQQRCSRLQAPFCPTTHRACPSRMVSIQQPRHALWKASWTTTPSRLPSLIPTTSSGT